ncbi:MAG: bifunctional phosphopantothenoylcysteine decarboxylase/phosphopantothenate--cysteine ligase CoaBC [Merismopedia sp. SIO2A8]|nr:bifunctional phosphopantothenoylcysteine decarboxylase/phosphopantothenate--cysteine ligase CoaBC [Merismopedia sp. SIO2A8]
MDQASVHHGFSEHPLGEKAQVLGEKAQALGKGTQKTSLVGHKVLVGVSGGIAAYKVCEVVSTLAKAGASVQVILTDAAQKFVTPLTFAALSRNTAYTDQDFWAAHHPRPLHIDLGEWADVFLIAPLSAHTLAQITHGLADNLLTNTLLASTCPVLLAPAMNTDMWEQETVQRNWQQIENLKRYHSVGPGMGRLACDRLGAGRMAEPSQILAHIQSLLQTQGQRDLTDKHLLISAGGTQEYLDPVRFIGNPSTGKMGIALTLAAHHRGATVTLVHGPMVPSLLASCLDLNRVDCIPATTAAEMHDAMRANFPAADWVIMAAAVADVKPSTYHPSKLSKTALPNSLPLTPVVDIIADLGQQKQSHQTLVGFAAQTGDIVAPAREKLVRKKLDAIAANPIDQQNSGFGGDQNQAVLLDRNNRQRTVPQCSKLQLAHVLLDFVKTIES